MFVRNCWYVAGWDYELTEERLLPRSILGEPIVFFRKQDGGIAALEDRCCHRAAPLSLGRKEGSDIRCMYHGLKFDSHGQCIEIPGQDAIPANAHVRSYPVVEQDSWIWIWMGDAAHADINLIPAAVRLDHPDWVMRSSYLHYQANYRIICDNLLDFSHISYVHRKTFGGGDAWAAQQPEIKSLDRGVRVQHVMKDVPPAPFMRERSPGNVDVWSTYDFLIPGILLLRGAQPRAGKYTSDLGEEDFTSYSCQAVTPETDKTSHYFFSWGPRSSIDNPELPDFMLQAALAAFEEDRQMIEAQQKSLDINPEIGRMVIAADRSLTMFRAKMDRLLQVDVDSTHAAFAHR